MIARGWTEETIIATIRSPSSIVEARDVRHRDDIRGGRNNEPARAYIAEDGHYVVVNLLTSEVIAVSNRMRTNWKKPSWY
jgi:hypothetical protein